MKRPIKSTIMVFVQDIITGDKMGHYKHLSTIEREIILCGITKGLSISKISKELGRNKSTISRELKRNTCTESYSPSKAQKLYSNRRRICCPRKKLSNQVVYNLVKEKFLQQQWSPQQISERIRLEKPEYFVSFNTIYRGIYSGMFDSKPLSHGEKGAKRHLRHKGKPRRRKGNDEKRGKIPITNNIADRPKEANERTRIGDWEADTVLGKPGKACLVTLDDRKSRFLICKKAAGKKAPIIKDVMIHALENERVETITPDRGKEFAEHGAVTKHLGGKQFYFPLPHHPWQRGTNENTNGLLREYFPKRKDITNYSDEYIAAVTDKINKRPRKCLGYKTPFEVYYSKTLHLI